jgi:hypothetical protein
MSYDLDDDGWQAYKDGVATGQLNEDGSVREPDEPDWTTLADNDTVPGAGLGDLLDPDPSPHPTEAPF